MNDSQHTTKELTPEQVAVLKEKGTEPPFSGKYVHHKGKGMYTCASCGVDLFSSETKFDSQTGWPSFYDVVEKGYVKLQKDTSHGMDRTEVVCANCGGHLGHLFNDGPTKTPDGKDCTGLRYCINSLALDFKEKK